MSAPSWQAEAEELRRLAPRHLTLCAEEVCPVFLGTARRLHWGLPDPAGATEAAQLQSFRDVRDELQRRLAVVFAP